jgi:hypothetical protein
MTATQTAPLTVATDGNPFKGLVPYREDEPLFARDADVDLIQSRLWAGSFTVLFAASGVGKTSFLNAKLIPVLRNIFGASDVLVPRGWARIAPDEAITDAINTLRAASLHSPKGGILILDQFEEVFQHFPNPELLKRLGSVLAAFSNDPESNLRILLSVREEFLAELTVFDNFIPGLLINYYRLNKLTPQQAEVIVKKTAKLAGVEVSSNAKVLINDLQSVKEGSSGQPLTFVDPPYLQIVCHRIWCREKPTAAGNAMFLATYEPGEARIELDQYCRDKLKKLSQREKVLVRKALGYLTGPHEAKKYARLPELEQEFGLRKGSPLGHALALLSDETVRILRTWEEFEPAVNGEKLGQPVKVFELYHDMYAPMLWKWRGEQERKEYRTALFKVAIAAVLSFFLVLLPIWAYSPVRNHLSKPTYGSTDELANVLELRNVLSHTIIGRPLGDHLWREYNHRLFTLAALMSDSDAALDYRLAELSVQGRPAGDAFDQALGAAGSLLNTCRVGNASDAALIDQGGLSRIIAGAAGVIVTCLPKGRVKSQPLDISFKDAGVKSPLPGRSLKAASRSEPYAGLIRILGFSSTGEDLVAAWVDESKIKVAVFSTDTGRKVAPTEADAVLPILPADLPLQFSPNFVGLPPSPQAAAAFGSALPSSAQKAVDTNAGLASVIQDMKAAFGPTGLIALVAGDLKTLFLYDTNKDNRVIRRTQFTDVADVEFAPHGTGTFALAVRPKNSLFPDQTVQFGTIAWNEAKTLPSPPATLPVGSRLIFNADQAILAQAGSRWGWVSSKGFVPIADFVPPGFPQAWNENQDILLCKDGSGKLIFSHLQRSSIPLKIPDSGSQAKTRSTSPRRLTSSSAARFVTSGEFLSLDTDGSVVRKWKVPASLNTGIATASTGRPEYTCKKGRYCSGDNEWGADFSDGELRIVGAKPWKWKAASNQYPEAITVSSEGDRVLLWFPNEIVYVQARRQQDATVTIRQLRREKAIDGVFGPGKDRVTLLSTDSIAIFRLDLLPTDIDKAEAPQPEWHAEALGYSLFKNGDEQGVVLYSDDWIHRFTESHTAWPNVVSVLLDVPIADPLSPTVFPESDRRYFLRSEDVHRNNVVLIDGTNRRIDFEAEAKRFDDLGGSIYPLQWIATWDLSPCKKTEMQNKAAQRNQSDAKGADAKVPANVRDDNAKILPVTAPIPGSWRELKCSWEHRTGRRTESE